MNLPRFLTHLYGQWKKAAISKLICLWTKWCRSFFAFALSVWSFKVLLCMKMLKKALKVAVLQFVCSDIWRDSVYSNKMHRELISYNFEIRMDWWLLPVCSRTANFFQKFQFQLCYYSILFILCGLFYFLIDFWLEHSLYRNISTWPLILWQIETLM